MKFFVLSLLLLAVVCCSSARRTKERRGVFDQKKVQQFAHSVMHAKRTIGQTEKAKKGHGGEYSRCIGAKCWCDDNSLLTSFLNSVASVIASCKLSTGLDEYYWASELTYVENGYDFYGDACTFMYYVGLEIEDYKVKEKTIYDDYYSILTCCDMRELSGTFGCLGTYMSLWEMKMTTIFRMSPNFVFPDELFIDLEYGSRYQCDSQFYSENCLVLGLMYMPDLHQCALIPSILDAHIPPIYYNLQEIEYYVFGDGSSADNSDNGASTDSNNEGSTDSNNEGSNDGNNEGSDDGNNEGSDDGNDEGSTDGNDEESTNGNDEGSTDGNDEGSTDGNDEESTDGNDEGSTDGNDEGSTDGNDEGSTDGNDEGSNDSNNEGSNDGNNEGSDDGNNEGSNDGNNEGSDDGNNEGSTSGKKRGHRLTTKELINELVHELLEKEKK